MVAVRMSWYAAALAVALSVFTWPTVGHAYTPEEDQACRGDAFRLCSSEIPDVDRITACMERKKSQLSPACRKFFGPSQQATARPGQPTNIKPAAVRKSKSRSKKATKPDAA